MLSRGIESTWSKNKKCATSAKDGLARMSVTRSCENKQKGTQTDQKIQHYERENRANKKKPSRNSYKIASCYLCPLLIAKDLTGSKTSLTSTMLRSVLLRYTDQLMTTRYMTCYRSICMVWKRVQLSSCGCQSIPRVEVDARAWLCIRRIGHDSCWFRKRLFKCFIFKSSTNVMKSPCCSPASSNAI